MPALGRQDPEVGVGVIPLNDVQDARRVREFHRERERSRMNIPEEPDPIIQLSEEQQVFIYNVGPWRFQQSLASYGDRTIPALAEDKVLTSEYAVAGPLVIDGLPREYYPAEGEAKVIYHRPLKNRGRQSKRPGFDFAMEVIGCGIMVNASCDLRNSGVFISEQREQLKPDKGSDRPAWDAYNKWISDIKDAQDKLRKRLARMCEDANTEYARGRFADVRNDQIYQAARLLRKTEVDCPWLKDTAEQSAKEACPGCGMTIRLGIIKCPHCAMRVCSDEQWEKVKNRYV